MEKLSDRWPESPRLHSCSADTELLMLFGRVSFQNRLPALCMKVSRQGRKVVLEGMCRIHNGGAVDATDDLRYDGD